jgi:acyl-CoA thioester hydrolase
MREHTVSTRVRYGETDQMGVVYHAHYLAYFELGRTEFLRAAGLAYAGLERRGIYLVVTEALCRYRSPAHYDDVLRIQTRVSGLGKASVRFEYAIRTEDGRLVADGHTELASVDARKKPSRLPEDVAGLLR